MKLYHVVLEATCEAEAWFDESGKLLAGWTMNDAHWRGEYMNPLLEALGYNIKQVYETDFGVEEVVDGTGYVVESAVVDDGSGLAHLVQKTKAFFR